LADVFGVVLKRDLEQPVLIAVKIGEEEKIEHLLSGVWPRFSHLQKKDEEMKKLRNAERLRPFLRNDYLIKVLTTDPPIVDEDI